MPETGNPPEFLLDQVACERDERWLFRGLSLHAGAGDVVRVLGRNGAGKTTLLRGIAGLNSYLEGRIRRPADCLYLGHRSGVSAPLTVRENLEFRVSVLGMPVMTAEQEQDALESVRLAGYADVPVGQLSAGQQRRVGLALLYLPDSPTGWLLDEPFTALDQEGISSLCRRMSVHREAGGIILFTSHQDPAGLVYRSLRLERPVAENAV